MRTQLKHSSLRIFSVISAAVLVSACGTAGKRTLYVQNPSTNQSVIPTLDPFASGSTNPINTSLVAPISIAAVPSKTAATGQTVYLVGSGTSNNLFNFQLQSNSIGATFVGNSTGVSNVGVTSSTPGSVTVTASSASGGFASPGQITITFTGSTTTSPYPGTYSACSLQGPNAISGYSSPQVGGSYYFSVQKNSTSYYGYSEQLKIINVWTPDSSEIGRYYYAWDKFWMTFNSGGQKVIYVRAQSLTNGTICDAQLSIYVRESYVDPTPGPVPPTGGSCGMPSAFPGACFMQSPAGYYFNGSSCVQGYQPCTTMPFQTLYQCQQAVSAGQCTSSGPVTSPGIQTVYRMDDFALVNDNLSTWGSMAHYYTQNPSEAGNYFKNPLAAFKSYTISAGSGCDAQLYKCAYFRSQGDARQFLSLNSNCDGHFRNGSAVNPSVGYVCTYQKTGTAPLYLWYRAASEGRIYSTESSSQILSNLGYVRGGAPVAYVPGAR